MKTDPAFPPNLVQFVDYRTETPAQYAQLAVTPGMDRHASWPSWLPLVWVTSGLMT